MIFDCYTFGIIIYLQVVVAVAYRFFRRSIMIVRTMLQ